MPQRELLIPYQHGHRIHVWGPDKSIINDPEMYRRKSKLIIKDAGLTIIGKTRIVPYPGIGFTFMAALSESGIMGHTWDEEDYANYLLHTCSPNIQPSAWGDIVKKHLNASEVQVEELFKPQYISKNGILIPSPSTPRSGLMGISFDIKK